ncbi:MAG: hypothetical protein ACRCZI_11315 [Cetobacterium sp.]
MTPIHDTTRITGRTWHAIDVARMGIQLNTAKPCCRVTSQMMTTTNHAGPADPTNLQAQARAPRNRLVN